MADLQTRAVVLDIEGTTTPFEFVHETLFPYARSRIADVLRTRHSEPQIAPLIAEAALLAGCAASDIQEIAKVFLAWSDEDRKIPVLKRLQSIIWKEAYQD